VAKSIPGLGGGVAAPAEMNVEHRTSNAQHRMKNKPPLPSSVLLHVLVHADLNIL